MLIIMQNYNQEIYIYNSKDIFFCMLIEKSHFNSQIVLYILLSLCRIYALYLRDNMNRKKTPDL